MDSKQLLILGASVLASPFDGSAMVQGLNEPYAWPKSRSIRHNSKPYKAAVKEQIEAAVRLEPEVLALNSVVACGL